MQMHEFSKQNAKMEMTAEMMDDAMEDMFEVDEGEADDLVNQVCTPGALRYIIAVGLLAEQFERACTADAAIAVPVQAALASCSDIMCVLLLCSTSSDEQHLMSKELIWGSSYHTARALLELI
jgi:hypothetical protein